MKYSGHKKLLGEYQNYPNCFYPPWIVEEHWLVYKHNPEGTGLNYVRREYATAINVPCLFTLLQWTVIQRTCAA